MKACRTTQRSNNSNVSIIRYGTKASSCTDNTKHNHHQPHSTHPFSHSTRHQPYMQQPPLPHPPWLCTSFTSVQPPPPPTITTNKTFMLAQVVFTQRNNILYKKLQPVVCFFTSATQSRRIQYIVYNNHQAEGREMQQQQQ